MSTALEAPVPCVKDVNVVMERPEGRSAPGKKNLRKVPKKIHKAEREKLKRDHYNVLFLELGQTLEQAHQNNGKARILSDATRLLRDLLAQVDSLKNENATLLTESHYVTIETNELREENSTLEAEIKKLQSELEKRSQSKPAWNLDLSQLQNNSISQLLEDHCLLPLTDHASQSAPVEGSVFVVPLHHDSEDYPTPNSAVTARVLSNVSRPHARYPSEMDSWPSQILSEQPKATPEAQLCTSTSTSTSTEGDQRFGHA